MESEPQQDWNLFGKLAKRTKLNLEPTLSNVSGIRIHSQIQNYKSKIESYLLTGKFGKDVIWNLGSLALLGASGVLINTIIASYQSPASLGIFNQAFAFYIVLSQFAVGGMQFS